MTTTLKSITGVGIRISPNKSKRTFTIRINGSKYRTYPMSRQEFEHAQYWTGNDWIQFLKTDEYHEVR